MKFANRVEISGRATRDAVRSGRGPFRFSIAVGGGKKRDSEERWPTEYFDVVSWDDNVGEVKRGAEVLVIGRLKQATWEKDWQKHSRVEIVATEISKPGAQPKQTKQPPITPKYPIPEHEPRERKVAEVRPITSQDPITDADIPF